jgi:hypothetical protein
MRFYRVGRQDLNCHKRGAYYKIEEDCKLNNRVIIDKVIVQRSVYHYNINEHLFGSIIRVLERVPLSVGMFDLFSYGK